MDRHSDSERERWIARDGPPARDGETDETARHGKGHPMKDREPRKEQEGKKKPEAQARAQHPMGTVRMTRQDCHSISLFPQGQVRSPGAGTSRG